MTTTNRKTFTLRIEETPLKQLHYISKQNKRSVNNQIELLIQNFILEFQKENGEIPLSDEQ